MSRKSKKSKKRLHAVKPDVADGDAVPDVLPGRETPVQDSGKRFDITPRGIKNCAPYLLFLAIILILFWDVFAHGYVLDGNSDRRDFCFPFHLIARQAFRHWKILQWNPYIFCGSSFLFSTLNLSFYPTNWIAYCFPERQLPMVLTVGVMAHMFMGGVFAFAFLRQVTTDRFWALCGSIAYILSSTMIINMVTESHYYGLVLLPGLLYLIHTHASRGVAANIVLQALGYALLIVSGGVQIVIYVLGICGAYVVFLPLAERGQKRVNFRLPLMSLSAVVLALGVTAVRILPFFYDSRSYLKDKATYESFLETGLTIKECLIRLFLPHFFGEKIYPNTINILMNAHFGRTVMSTMNNFEAFSCYSGVFVAFFGLYVMLFVWNKETHFWKAIILLSTLTVTGSPLAFLHYVATGSSNIHFGRLAWLLPICFCCLFVHAAPVVTRSSVHLLRLLIFVIVTSGLTIAASVWIANEISQQTRTEVLRENYIQASQWHFAVASAALIGLLTFRLLCQRPWRDRVFKVLFLGGMLADLLLIARTDSNSSRGFLVPPAEFEINHGDPQFSDEMKDAKMYRVLALSDATLEDKTIAFNIYNISGFDQGAPAVISALYCYPDVPNRMAARTIMPTQQATAARVLELTSCAAVLNNQQTFQVANPLPRWSSYNQYLTEPTAGLELRQTLDRETDIHETVILNKEPIIPVKPGGKRGEVRLIQEGFGEIILESTAPDNSLLLLTDTYYEGWKAFVDGSETDILRANAAFRAVAVPAGKHEVRFRFIHRGIVTGGWITAVSLALLAAMACLAFFRRRPRPLG